MYIIPKYWFACPVVSRIPILRYYGYGCFLEGYLAEKQANGTMRPDGSSIVIRHFFPLGGGLKDEA